MACLSVRLSVLVASHTLYPEIRMSEQIMATPYPPELFLGFSTTSIINSLLKKGGMGNRTDGKWEWIGWTIGVYSCFAFISLL